MSPAPAAASVERTKVSVLALAFLPFFLLGLFLTVAPTVAVRAETVALTVWVTRSAFLAFFLAWSDVAATAEVPERVRSSVSAPATDRVRGCLDMARTLAERGVSARSRSRRAGAASGDEHVAAPDAALGHGRVRLLVARQRQHLGHPRRQLAAARSAPAGRPRRSPSGATLTTSTVTPRSAAGRQAGSTPTKWPPSRTSATACSCITAPSATASHPVRRPRR